MLVTDVSSILSVSLSCLSPFEKSAMIYSVEQCLFAQGFTALVGRLHIYPLSDYDPAGLMHVLLASLSEPERLSLLCLLAMTERRVASESCVSHCRGGGTLQYAPRDPWNPLDAFNEAVFALKLCSGGNGADSCHRIEEGLLTRDTYFRNSTFNIVVTDALVRTLGRRPHCEPHLRNHRSSPGSDVTRGSTDTSLACRLKQSSMMDPSSSSVTPSLLLLDDPLFICERGVWKTTYLKFLCPAKKVISVIPNWRRYGARARPERAVSLACREGGRPRLLLTCACLFVYSCARLEIKCTC